MRNATRICTARVCQAWSDYLPSMHVFTPPVAPVLVTSWAFLFEPDEKVILSDNNMLAAILVFPAIVLIVLVLKARSSVPPRERDSRAEFCSSGPSGAPRPLKWWRDAVRCRSVHYRPWCMAVTVTLCLALCSPRSRLIHIASLYLTILFILKSG